MKNSKIKQVVLPLLAAMIWGGSFVAQSISTGHVGAFTFTMARSFAATLVLLAVLLAVRVQKRDMPQKSAAEKKTEWKDLIAGGLSCGVLLTLGANLQQLGLEQTSAGKAGFITTLYVVLVPVAGIFFHKRVPPRVWVSIAIAVAGLYFLCMQGGGAEFSLNGGDVYVLLCAFAFTGQIFCVDYFVQRVDGIRLSCAQFAVMTLLSAVVAFTRESVSLSAIWACMPYILYVGVLSGGVGYTLQILAQKDGDPVVVSLLLSLEAFFAAVCGAIILHERLSAREYLGCALMLAAVFLSQLPEKSGKAVESGSGT